MHTLTVLAVEEISRVFVQHHHLPLPGTGSVIDVADEADSGGFASIFPVKGIDGAAPLRPLIAKVFRGDALVTTGGIDEMGSHIAKLLTTLDKCQEHAWPDDLLGAPFCVLTAEMAGTRTLITLMLDLRHLGYGPCPFDPADAPGYRARAFRQRAVFALAFAARYALLERVGFVHGDINPENVLVSADRCDVQIIDLDTGTFVVDGSERPLTPGKPDECMPPEVTSQAVNGFVEIGRYTAFAERWSVGSMVGYFLFAVHPGFFLREISATCLDEYASSGRRWPDIDTRSRTFTNIRLNGRIYRHVLRGVFDSAPPDLVELFGRFFAAGTSGELRPSAEEWVECLDNANEPPAIESIAVDPRIALAGDMVRLSWTTKNASYVEIPGIGRRPPTGDAMIQVWETSAFVVHAYNSYQRTCTATSPTIRIIEMPHLDTIPVPSFPGITLRADIYVPPQLALLTPSRSDDNPPPCAWRSMYTPRLVALPQAPGTTRPAPEAGLHLDLPASRRLSTFFTGLQLVTTPRPLSLHRIGGR